MEIHTLHILVTVPQWPLLNNCTLFFDTIRTGFPNANIFVHDNANTANVGKELRRRCKEVDACYGKMTARQHHADWIRHIVHIGKGPLIIVDPDTIWFENCEDILPITLLRGYFVPCIWNEWAGCISYERFHTSFLMVQDAEKLRERIGMFYPLNQPYRPLDPFRPCVGVVRGQRMFWDTCSTLYNMFGGLKLPDEFRRKYAHVNSASFREEMLQCVENKEAFEEQHRRAEEKDYEWFKEWYKAEDRYYELMHQKAMRLLEGQEQPIA